MMSTYTVYYSLRTDDFSYEDFFAELDHIEESIHVSSNLFFLHSRRSAQQIYEELSKFIGHADSLLITKVAGPWVGKLAPHKEKWLQERLAI